VVEKKQNQIDCDCRQHVEITNFIITDIDVKNAIKMKRIRMFDGQSFLAILYDQVILDAAEFGEHKWTSQSSEINYNIRFH
jgi:hypothetical protein